MRATTRSGFDGFSVPALTRWRYVIVRGGGMAAEYEREGGAAAEGGGAGGGESKEAEDAGMAVDAASVRGTLAAAAASTPASPVMSLGCNEW